MRKLLPWVLGAALAIPVAVPAVAPVAVLAQGGCPAASPTPAPSAEPLLMPEVNRLALFDAVWGSIDAGYLDPAFNGKDWDAIGDAYAPLFLQVEDAWEIYDLTTEMVDELGDDEVRFISPLVIENLPPAERDYVGIGALVDTTAAEEGGEGPRILYLFPDSGAAAAGLAIRDRIVSVDGDPCVSIRKIRGPEGTIITLGVESPGQPVREVAVERRRIDPTVSPISTTLGPSGSIGYLRMPSMEGQNTIDGVTAALEELETQDIEGLILDVRSVGLGGLGVTVGIIAHLLDGEAGTFFTRAETSPLELPESELLDTFKDIPIVVLVDEDSSGEPERLAWILQSTGRATVVGQKTPGRTRVIQELPMGDGSILQLVTVSLELPDGTKLERQGITPDVTVTDDWLDFPQAEDPYLLAALDLLGATAGPSPSPMPTPSPSASAGPSPTIAPSPDATDKPAATKKPRKRTPRP